jgi:hypothetical protein
VARQHSVPLLLTAGNGGAVPLTLLSQQAGPDGISEADIQALVHEHPASLPIAEVDPIFIRPVPICQELNTPAGPIDNFMVTPTGLPVLVECKLWRNPEGRREVVGQILDYAKELSRWSSSDLQREVSRCLKRGGNPLLDMVRAATPGLDEVQFNDALTNNLRRGRFLLLIVGDGIREGVEAIAEYLQRHAGLHFSLGLIELPVYIMPDGRRLVAPRVVARTLVVTRHVVQVPDGHALQEASDADTEAEIDPEHGALLDARQRFWQEFLSDLKLDDPEQPIPRPSRQGYVAFTLPAPGGSAWLTVFRDMRRDQVGVMLSSYRNSPGEFAMQAVADDWQAVKEELNGSAKLTERDGRPCIIDSYNPGSLENVEIRRRAFSWLHERTNTFVNVMRPRVRSAVADYALKAQ